MLAVRNKNVFTNVKLLENNEISAIRMAANLLSDCARVNRQACYSSLLASEALQTHMINDRTAFIYGTDASIKRPQFIIITFADAIIWGEDNERVDYLVVGIIPDDDDDVDLDAIVALVKIQFSGLAGRQDALKDDAAALTDMIEQVQG